MNCAVRFNRPSMSRRKSLWSHTPASAPGCSICTSRAAVPPIIIDEKSACTRQLTDPGPNSPSSPAGRVRSIAPSPAPVSARTCFAMAWRTGFMGNGTSGAGPKVHAEKPERPFAEPRPVCPATSCPGPQKPSDSRRPPPTLWDAASRHPGSAVRRGDGQVGRGRLKAGSLDGIAIGSRHDPGRRAVR